jgi:hypothetical protein
MFDCIHHRVDDQPHELPEAAPAGDFVIRVPMNTFD